MMDLVAVAIGIGVFLLAGDAVTGLLGPSVADSRTGRWAAALLLGPGCVAFLLFLLNLAGVPLGAIGSWTITALVVVGWLALHGRRRRRLRVARPLPARAGLVADLPVWLLLLVPVAIGLAFAITIPPVKDSLGNWSLKTLVLFEDRTVFTADFHARHRYLFHPNYPLLAPLAQVFLYGLRGAVMDHAAKVVFPLVHLAIALLLVALLRDRLPRRVALLLGALLAATPHFYRTHLDLKFAGSGPSGYADPMFAALAGGTCLLLAAWLRERRPGDLRSGAFLLGLCLFTKNEGLPLTLALGLGVGVALLLDRLRGRSLPRLAEIAVAALLVASVAGPWFAFRAGLPAEDENYQHRLSDPAALRAGAWRTPTILTFSVEEALGSDNHAMVWPLLLAALVVLRRRLLAAENLMLIIVLAAMATVYFLVFVVTPLPIVDSLYTSIPRTFFQLAPVAIGLVGFLLAAEIRAPSDRGSS